MVYKSVISIILVVLFLSCDNKISTQNNSKKIHSYYGNYGFIWHNIYGELYFDSLNITFKMEDGLSGPYNYKIVDDTIKYFNDYYAIQFINPSTIHFINSNDTLKLQKIFSLSNNNKYIDPFYLRRCDFLVNNNLISMDSALNYLCAISFINNDSDETIIPINRKVNSSLPPH